MGLTEKQKMLAGEPYNSRDPELIARYHLARQLLRQFAEADSTDPNGRATALTRLLGRVGRNVWIEPPFFCDYGENILIGDDVFINYNCVLLDDNLIEIGDGVLIGPAAQIYTASHPIAAQERILTSADGRPEGYLTTTKPVRIGNRVWIGGGAIILPGVEIGAGTTIGAGSVVTRSIPANCFAVGNPCRVVRELPLPPR